MAIQIPYTDGFIHEPSVSNAESKANKGAPNGYAPLDGNAKVPSANLPVVDVSGQIAAHNSATTSVHGIANTADLVTTSNLATHTAVTTSIHGIANTANLVLTSDSRLTNSRAPTTHKSSHATGGTDALSVSDIGAVATTDTRIANIRGGSIDTRDGASEDDIDGGNGGAILQVGGNSENGFVQTGIDENEEPIFENRVQSGGNAGYIWQNGATGGDYGAGGSAGFINTSAYGGNSGGNVSTGGGISGGGGYINTSNGGGFIRTGVGAEIDTFQGGKITTAYGGGSINTCIKGSIQLGRMGERTTLNGSASGGNKTITLPNETGTIALASDVSTHNSATTSVHGIANTANLVLTNDSRLTDARTPTSTLPHTHGNITNDGKVLVPYGGIISASAVDAFSGAGTYSMIQGSGVGGSIQVASNGAITIASAGTGYVDGLATRAGGSRFNLVTQSTQNASANLPVITTTGGNISVGSFGTTANTFCQGNDSRLSDSRIPTAHTHAIAHVIGLQTNLDSFVRLTSSEVTFITNSTASADISLFNLSANKTFICSSMTLYFQTGNSVTNALDTNNPLIRLYDTSSTLTPLMSSWGPSTNSLAVASAGSAYRSNASGEKIIAIATGTSGKTIVAKCTIPTPTTGQTQCRYASFIGRVIVEGYYL